MHEVIKAIGDLGIIPVVTIADAQDAIPLAKALAQGGLPVIEITFRTDAAEQSIKDIASHFPEMLVGAGTILNVSQAERAVNAGAQYIVSAGLNTNVVQYCLEKEIPVIPGCSNPTDLTIAMEFGLDVIKFFPAEALGGLKTLEAISKPFHQMKFIPTGGISIDNLNRYLALKNVWACGGSWMVKEELISKKDFATVTRLTEEAVEKMLGFSLAHVGLNAPDPETSLAWANRFASIFALPIKEGKSSIAAGSMFEVRKSKAIGSRGHLAIKTNNMRRAISYFQRRGIELDLDKAEEISFETPIAVYLKEEIGGFAIHLLKDQ